MNKLFLISFGFVGFSLFAPPKLEKDPPYFTPSKEIQESQKYQKKLKEAQLGSVIYFLDDEITRTLYRMNPEGQLRLPTNLETRIYNS